MREGDLCSFEAGDGTFRVAKVLKLEERIVHVRTYANVFSQRPTDVDPTALELGSVFDENFGLGHMPLASADFAAWRPELIRNEPVLPESSKGSSCGARMLTRAGPASGDGTSASQPS